MGGKKTNKQKNHHHQQNNHKRNLQSLANDELKSKPTDCECEH